jgi:hypothetical protein
VSARPCISAPWRLPTSMFFCLERRSCLHYTHPSTRPTQPNPTPRSCILDVRPRAFDDDACVLLANIAAMVTRERETRQLLQVGAGLGRGRAGAGAEGCVRGAPFWGVRLRVLQQPAFSFLALGAAIPGIAC